MAKCASEKCLGNDMKGEAENKKRGKDCIELLVGVRDQTRTYCGRCVSESPVAYFTSSAVCQDHDYLRPGDCPNLP